MKEHNRFLIYLPLCEKYLCYPKSKTAKIYHRHRKDDLREMARDLHQFDGELVALTPARDVEIHDGLRYTNRRMSGAELRLMLSDHGKVGTHPLDGEQPPF